MHQIVPVILCGGSGTRLWPLSRAGFPKQFLLLSGTTNLFQQAVERVNQLGRRISRWATPWLSQTKSTAFCRAKQHALLKVYGYNLNVSVE
jgi:mannose-1-phosphate guanylyltransferase/mannose-6-phosphate isomerase